MAQTRRDLLLMAGAGAAMGSAAPALGAGDTVIYRNSFRSAADIADWRLEGSAVIRAENGVLEMENARSADDGQEANYVFWCPVEFPADIEITWRFRAVRDPGLCVFLFGAMGIADGGLVSPFDPRIAPRQGVYSQYTDSDLEYLSVSYFRRRWESERSFHVTNLRYAPGFELLATGPDPLPCVSPDNPMHTIKVRKLGRQVTFFIEDLKLLDWTAREDQPMPGRGLIGFRQMAPLKAQYADLEVRAIGPGSIQGG